MMRIERQKLIGFATHEMYKNGELIFRNTEDLSEIEDTSWTIVDDCPDCKKRVEKNFSTGISRATNELEFFHDERMC